MIETIFDDLTDVYHTINSWEWHPALGKEPENFPIMPFEEKCQLCCSILQKLEYLLNNTADTLISWSWWEKYLHRTFEEWLRFQMAKIPDTTYHQKNGRIASKLRRWIRKVQGLQL